MADHAYTPNEGTWGAGYVMVPGWLLARRPSANALMLYTHLAMHGRFDHATAVYEECRPSIKRLSQGDPRSGYPGTGMSPATIHRALRELVELGAITGRPAYDRRGGQLPTIYRVMFGRIAPTSDTPPLSPVTPPPVTSDTPPLSLVRDNPEPSTQNQVPTSPPTPRTKPADAAVAEAGRQEETEETGDQDQAVQIIQAIRWPARTRADRGTRRRLTTLARQCLAAGHPAVAIQAAVTEGLPAVWGAGLLVRRLEELAATTPDPAVVAAAEREAAAQARERLGRTPHRWVDDPRRPSYCGACGRTRATHPAEPQDQERVDQDQEPAAVRSATPATAGSTTTVERCAEHGRRVCVTCHGGRNRNTTGSTSTPAPVSGPTPAGQELHRALAAMAGRERMATTPHEFVADELTPTYCQLCGHTRNHPHAHGTRTVNVPAPAMTGGVR